MSESGTPSFRLEQCLGSGDHGEVYLATVRFGPESSDVTLELLRTGARLDPEAAARLRAEGQLLAALRHPNILAVKDLVFLGGRWALVSDRIGGQDLAEILRDEGRLPTRVALEVIAQVGMALDAAFNGQGPDGQALHVVHRDVKPGTIRVQPDGIARLVEFGIGRALVDHQVQTQIGLVDGTIGYMAPERFATTDVHPPGDAYAAGCVLYEMLSGKSLMADTGLRRIAAMAMDRKAHQDFVEQRLDALPIGVPDAVRELVGRTLSWRAADRPAGAGLAAACESLGAVLPGDGVGAWAAARRWPQPAAVSGALEGQTLVPGDPLQPDDSAAQVDPDESLFTAEVALRPGSGPVRDASFPLAPPADDEPADAVAAEGDRGARASAMMPFVALVLAAGLVGACGFALAVVAAVVYLLVGG